jgi:hypothetical protein
VIQDRRTPSRRPVFPGGSTLSLPPLGGAETCGAVGIVAPGRGRRGGGDFRRFLGGLVDGVALEAVVGMFVASAKTEREDAGSDARGFVGVRASC